LRNLKRASENVGRYSNPKKIEPHKAGSCECNIPSCSNLAVVLTKLALHFKLALECENTVSRNNETNVTDKEQQVREILMFEKNNLKRPFHVRMFPVNETFHKLRIYFESPCAENSWKFVTIHQCCLLHCIVVLVS
jgi:hypothetical protein